MATVTGLTAERTKQIENNAFVAARLGGSGGKNLILTKYDGSDVDLGDVAGAKGDPGGGSPFKVLTAAAYAALATKDPATLYVIQG